MITALPLTRDAAGLEFADLARSVGHALATDHIALISGFPIDASRLMSFLEGLGTPLTYYGDTHGSHPDHPAIHRVHYLPEDAARGELHAVDGQLSIHSAQSLRDPRPRYFAMLMCDDGWQGAPKGSNGESVLVRWSWALARMRDESPREFHQLLAILRGRVEFPDGKQRNLVYELPDSADPLDLGVRFKYDLLEHLQSTAESVELVRVIGHLLDTAGAVALVQQLNAGELVIVDNDRWGHGRSDVRGERFGVGGRELNPRELWSVTLA